MIINYPPVPFVKYHVVHLSHQATVIDTDTQQLYCFISIWHLFSLACNKQY